MLDELSIESMTKDVMDIIDMDRLPGLINRIDAMSDTLITEIINSIMEYVLLDTHLKIVLDAYVISNGKPFKLVYVSPECEKLYFKTMKKECRKGSNVKFVVSGEEYSLMDIYAIERIFIEDEEKTIKIDVYSIATEIISDLRQSIYSRNIVKDEGERSNVIEGYFNARLVKK